MNGAEKSSAMWQVCSYAVITIGELFLSPMALSLVSDLSPPRLTAPMMGGWLLATSIGNKLSGVLAKAWCFVVNSIGPLLAAFAVFLMLRWLREIVKIHTGK